MTAFVPPHQLAKHFFFSLSFPFFQLWKDYEIATTRHEEKSLLSRLPFKAKHVFHWRGWSTQVTEGRETANRTWKRSLSGATHFLVGAFESNLRNACIVTLAYVIKTNKASMWIPTAEFQRSARHERGVGGAETKLFEASLPGTHDLLKVTQHRQNPSVIFLFFSWQGIRMDPLQEG